MSSFDEDLALAISLSLQEQQQSSASNSRDDPILVIDSSDEEQPLTDLRKPPMNKPSTSKSASRPSSSRRPTTQPASSRNPKAKPEPAKLDEIIDLDTTIEIGNNTATEAEDTATRR
ncbi:tyrosyl-DNA phosphodiesterase [Ceratobasidium sp. AG-Ba]|nr:tyrosyl-DNA phosphodiesterase [Ceratobasidium sp. AG-Ba]